MGHKVLFAALAAVVATLLIGAAAASGQPVAPDTTQLLEISNAARYPQKVAADDAGNIYVTDPVKKKLKVYNRRGQRIRTMGLPSMPYSVAAASPDKVYVGLRGTVAVYDSGGARIGNIGSVRFPKDMAVLSDGTLYVLDAGEGNVKIFGPSGAMTVFGTKGTGDGQFKGASALAVDEASGLLYVMDNGHVITDPYNSSLKINVDRIQVFDLDGTSLTYSRKFSNFGYKSVGKVANPSGMAADRAGRLYVSDGMQNIIVVYDSYGTYLKTIVDTGNPFFFPIGLDFEAGRLYVACYVGKSVRVVGIDKYTDLEVITDSLSFMAQAGYDPPEQEVMLSNGGPGQMQWTATASDGWIVIPEATGTVGGESTGSFGVTVDASGLEPGIVHSGTVEVSTPGAIDKVKVTVEVMPPPALSVDPGYFGFSIKQNAPAPAVFVNVELSNDLGGALTWKATGDSPAWLGISPEIDSSNSSTAANLQIAHGDLAPGIYRGTITVRAMAGDVEAGYVIGTPAFVTVDLEVLPSGGKILVNTNNDEASFDVVGPEASYSGTGRELFAEDVPEGDYTVTFNPVPGFRTPGGATATVVAEETVFFTGEYARLGNIAAAKGPGAENDTVIRIFNPFGEFTGVEFEAFAGERYGVNIAAGDIDGDGVDEIIAGRSGHNAPAHVRVFKADGTMLGGADFLAFDTKSGVKVGAGDIDGDGVDEIIALYADKSKTSSEMEPYGSDGKKSKDKESKDSDGKTSAQLRVFKYVEGVVVDTGVNVILSLGSYAHDVDVAAGDIDGDGLAEIGFTIYESNSDAKGDSDSRSAAVVYMRALRVDSSGGLGTWSVTDAGVFIDTGGKSTLALGDINGDGISEIVVGDGPDTRNSGSGLGVIDTYIADGTGLVSFSSASDKYGCDLSAGTSLTDDDAAEIVTGLGPGPETPATVRVFKGDGEEVLQFNAFDNTFYGVRVATGDFGY